MLLTRSLVSLIILAAPILAAAVPPTDSLLEARADTVTCKPKNGSASKAKFVVDIARAKAQAKEGGFLKPNETPKSGFPHAYGNGDGIKWGNNNCDNGKNDHWEYPVYWDGYRQKVWNQDKKKKDQDNTPLRVVYANKNGGLVYCGVMTHTKVRKDNSADPDGGKDFNICK